MFHLNTRYGKAILGHIPDYFIEAYIKGVFYQFLLGACEIRNNKNLFYRLHEILLCSTN